MKRSIVPSSTKQQNAGFTLLELVVVLGILAVLSLMLVPAFASSKGDGRVQRCMNNQKQLMQGWLLYTTDYNDRVMPNPGWATGAMDWSSAPDNTNTAILESQASSTIASYVKVAGLFKCPGDTYQSAANPGPRTRSISLNGVLSATSTGPTIEGSAPGGGIYYGSGSGGAGAARSVLNLIKPGPSKVFVILDEHPDSINDSMFLLNPGYPPSAEYWRDLPGSFHNGSGSISFADGHFELHKWLDAGTIYPVLMTTTRPWATVALRNSVDYEWMDSKMPYW